MGSAIVAEMAGRENSLARLSTIPQNRMPRHIAIIPDGNARWAKEHHLPTIAGHRQGAKALETIVNDLSHVQDIQFLTFWGFSADNWKRSKSEVTGLMGIFSNLLEKAVGGLKNRDGRFIHLGRKDRIPQELAAKLQQAEDETSGNRGQTLSIAIDFGGEDQAVRMIDKARKLPADIATTSQLVKSLRDGQGKVPPADLLIRTANEHRTSDIGWLNGAQTELVVLEKKFPDMTTDDVVDAIIEFSRRERRLGGREYTE
jgi:undecaprenyl diphosphate synthase